MQECRLELHPEKTKIVYCQHDDRRERYAQEKFDFLGYTFRPRSSMSRKGSTSSTSVRSFLRRPARPYGERLEFGSCTCAATHRLRIFPVCLIRSSRVGFNTTGGLPLGALSPPLVPQPRARPVGDAEIQKAEAPFSPSGAVAAACCSTHSTVLCSLAAGCAAWLCNGSRMSWDSSSIADARNLTAVRATWRAYPSLR